MQKTINYNLNKPEDNDVADITILNQNADIVDAELKKLNDESLKKTVYDTNNSGVVDNAEKVNGHSVEADVPANAKFTDTVTPIANNLTETVPGKALDATQGRELSKKISEQSPTITVTNITAGKTLTATDGVTTLTAQPIASQFVFTLPNRGKWTVTYEGESKEVDVLYNGDYAVAFGLEQLVNYVMLYDEGIFDGMSLHKHCAPSLPSNPIASLNPLTITYGGTAGDVGYVTDNTIDLSQYSQLFANVSKFTDNNLSSARGAVGYTDTHVIDGTDAPLYFNEKFGGELLFEIESQSMYQHDISKLNDNKYLFFTLRNGQSSAGAATIIYKSCFLTKVDDWQTWMNLGGVTGFTDLPTLLSDSTAMTALMSNADAVEYMVKRMTGDAMVAICQSSTAMNALVNNIAYEKAFNNEHWFKFMTMIPTSLEAMKSVAVKIPTMTSNTTPSGIVTATCANYEGSGKEYYAFDNFISSSGNYFYARLVPAPFSIEYEFTQAVKVFKADAWLGNVEGDANYVPKKYKYEYHDGTNWVDASGEQIAKVGGLYATIINKKVASNKWRLTVIETGINPNANNTIIREFKLYGKAV